MFTTWFFFSIIRVGQLYNGATELTVLDSKKLIVVPFFSPRTGKSWPGEHNQCVDQVAF